MSTPASQNAARIPPCPDPVDPRPGRCASVGTPFGDAPPPGPGAADAKGIKRTGPWHGDSVDEVARRLHTDPQTGLPGHEAADRRRQHGANEIAEGQRRGAIAIFLDQFRDFMIVVLIAAAIISGVLGDAIDTVVILAIIALNALIGFVQEYRAEQAVAALRRLAALEASVLRDGKPVSIPAADVVPGDLVTVEAGSAVPADLRFVEAVALRTDEAALTGESHPVEKTVDVVAQADAPLGDRHNMGYKGTVVTHGRGRGIVVATGMGTELGAIATLLHEGEAGRTPLQKRLARFGRSLALVVLAICTILFATGVLRGEAPLLMLLTAISLAVAAIPEALPAVVSVSLALGARKMVRRHALARKLPAVETLGSVTFICSDKTGTLTENRMHAEELHASGQTLPTARVDATHDPWRTFLHALALSNDAFSEVGAPTVGDPTEVALLEAARGHDVHKSALEEQHPRVGEVPFDPERARMTTLHADDGCVVAYTKGAPECVLPHCRDALGPAGPEPIEAGRLLEIAGEMAGRGLRVLAVAYRVWPELPSTSEPETVEADLTFVGLVGLLDPPRPEAVEAVRLCRSAGITPVMITGDHPATAGAIARRLDIMADGDAVLTGRELARLDPADLKRRVAEVRVYARATPEQKIQIVSALQDRGEVVAMTGDGVNDAPALRRADIGVAMGITGTDVAKEASDMILLDDNFATIVSAIREGRRIFDNIRKFIKYTMTSNAGEIWTIFLAPFLGLPIPLLPIHILWINLVTDGLPGLALAAEGEERGVMERPPRAPDESVFARGLWQHILWVGLLMGGVCLVTQAWALRAAPAQWQTMVFTVLTLSQLGHVLAVRSECESFFARGSSANHALAGAVALTFALQLATIYVPALNVIFRTRPLAAAELGLCLALSAIVFVAVEVEKGLVRRGLLYATAPGSDHPTKRSNPSQKRARIASVS